LEQRRDFRVRTGGSGRVGKRERGEERAAGKARMKLPGSDTRKCKISTYSSDCN